MDQLRAKGRKAWLFWRGDQQSALALARLRARGEAEVIGLVCVLESSSARDVVSPALRPLIEEQAASLELPLRLVGRGELASAAMIDAAQKADLRAIALPVIGDSKRYEIGYALAKTTGLEILTPLSGESTAELSAGLLADGYRSVVNRIDLSRIAPHLLGRVYSEQLLAELSPEVDPLGEDGAFDSFVCGGPILPRPISPRLLDMVEEGGHYRAVLGPGPRRAYGDA